MSYSHLEPPAVNCMDPRIAPEGRSRVDPPEGWVVDLDDPVSHTTQLLVLNVVCLSVTSVFVAGRLYTKCYLTRKLQSDDVACIIAMFLSIGFSVAVMIATRFGFGIHCWEFDKKHEGNYFRMQAVLYSTYSVLIFFVKAAILLMYIRIFDASRFIKYSVWSLFIPLAAFSVSSFFLSIFPCRPVRKFWTPGLPGKCIDTGILGSVSAIISIFTDIAIFVVPLRQVWKMRLPLRQRLQVIAVLGTGLVACGMSIARVVAFMEMFSSFDITWHTYEPALYTILEVNVGIIVGCMPTLKPLLRRHMPYIFGKASVRGQSNPKNTGSSGNSKSSRPPFTDFSDLDDIPLARNQQLRDDELETGLGSTAQTPSTWDNTAPGTTSAQPQPLRPSYPFPMI